MAVARRTPGFTGADLANVAERGSAADRSRGQVAGRRRRTRRGDRPRGRRPAEAHAADEREGEEDHRVPRRWSRAGRCGAEPHRPRAQDHDPAARARSRVHDGASRPRTSTPPRATRCSTSSPTCSVVGQPRRWSSTTRRPVRPTTSRRPRSSARAMVMQYGMSERIGAIRLGQGEGEVFLGRDMGHGRDYSEQIAEVDRRGGARLPRVRAPGGLRDPRREPRRARPAGRRAARPRDARPEEVAEIFERLRKRTRRPVWLSSTERPVSERGPGAQPQGARGREAASPNGSTAQASRRATVPVGGQTETQ